MTYHPREIKKEILRPYMAMMYGKTLTAYRLLNGYSLQDLHPTLSGLSNDMFTPYDVVRSLYECYLQSVFINTRYQTEEEIRYMGLWWNLRAMMERATLAKNRALEHPQLEEEELTIDTYKKEIESKYLSLKVKDIKDFQPDRFNPGFPIWPTPGKLYALAGVHKSQHEYLYKLHSIYAHCEPYSILQIGAAIKPGVSLDINGFISVHGNYLLQIMAMGLLNFSKAFPELETLIDSEPELRELIDVFLDHWSKDHTDKLENGESSEEDPVQP